jgi:hypothetical protein
MSPRTAVVAAFNAALGEAALAAAATAYKSRSASNCPSRMCRRYADRLAN